MEAIMKEIKLVCDTPFFDKVDVNAVSYTHLTLPTMTLV